VSVNLSERTNKMITLFRVAVVAWLLIFASVASFVYQERQKYEDFIRHKQVTCHDINVFLEARNQPKT
jgi:hypothetical protein